VVTVASAVLPELGERAAMTGGGQVAIEQDGDVIRVSLIGPRAGLASLCLASGAEVRILHASAAVGEAVYAKAADRWELKQSFEWQLRDSPQAGRATRYQVDRFLAEHGWVANASAAGSPKRDFRIRLRDERQFLAVTFLAVAEPMGVSHWPPTVADDCRLQAIAQGYLPQRAAFRPDTWYRLPAAP
jgi:hypothetical protein